MDTLTPGLLRKTPLQEEREARDRAIYEEYNALAALPGQSKTQINQYIMEKYGLHSTGTLYLIRKRVEERLRQEGGAQ